jgi:hypothetical protein
MLLALEKVTQDWGLTISVSKTKILAIGRAADTLDRSIEIKIRGETVEVVSSAKYLGSIL